MNRYDIHTHILPNLDDGSSDIDISMVLLEELENQGVTHLAFTPHFYSQYIDMSGNNEKAENLLQHYFQSRMDALQAVRHEYHGNMRFTFGAEVHMSENIIHAKDLSPLCYYGTNHMLAEMPYSSVMAENEVMWLKTLIEQYHIIPILAHIERYPVLVTDMKLLSGLREMGCKVQVNTESLYTRGLSKRIIKLINEGCVDFLGSDTHSTMRGCDYERGYMEMVKHCHADMIDRITENGRKLFKV